MKLSYTGMPMTTGSPAATACSIDCWVTVEEALCTERELRVARQLPVRGVRRLCGGRQLPVVSRSLRVVGPAVYALRLRDAEVRLDRRPRVLPAGHLRIRVHRREHAAGDPLSVLPVAERGVVARPRRARVDLALVADPWRVRREIDGGGRRPSDESDRVGSLTRRSGRLEQAHRMPDRGRRLSRGRAARDGGKQHAVPKRSHVEGRHPCHIWDQ